MKTNIEKSTKKNAKRLKRKHIQCPKCGSRIIDASLSTVTELKALSGTDPAADYYIKCNSCNAELSLRKLG